MTPQEAAFAFIEGPVKVRIMEAVQSAHLMGLAELASDVSVTDAERDLMADEWEDECLELMRRLVSVAGTIFATAGEPAAVKYLDDVLPIIARAGRTIN